MAIHLIETSDEDTVVAVTAHIGELLNEGQVKTALADTPGSKFVEECSNLVAEGHFEEYITRVSPHIDVVFSKCEASDIECVMNVLAHTLSRLPDDKIAALATPLASSIAAKTDDKAHERLAALMALYSVSTSPSAQFALLLIILEFASSSQRLAAGVVPTMRGQADEFVHIWGLDAKQAMQLHFALALLFKASGERNSKEYMKHVTAAFNLVPASDSTSMATYKGRASAALIDFVRGASMYQCDFLAAPVVKQLESDKDAKDVYALAVALLSGDVANVKKAVNAAVLEKVSMTEEAAMSKGRMMALIALGQAHVHESLSFEMIRSALDVPIEQVELWVLRAIGSKLIEAKIDQMSSQVTINKCTIRTFGSAEWASLQTQLHSWRDNLTKVMQTIQRENIGTMARGAAPVKA